MSKRAEELAAEALGTVFEYDPGDPKSHVLIAKIAGIIRVYGAEVRRRDAKIARHHNPKPLVPEITVENIACAAAIDREPLP